MPVHYADEPIDFGEAELEAEDREALAGLERLEVDSDDDEPEEQDAIRRIPEEHNSVCKVAEELDTTPVVPDSEPKAPPAPKERRTLVDLPTDVLREIVKEVRHCQCLTVCALDHVVKD